MSKVIVQQCGTDVNTNTRFCSSWPQLLTHAECKLWEHRAALCRFVGAIRDVRSLVEAGDPLRILPGTYDWKKVLDDAERRLGELKAEQRALVAAVRTIRAKIEGGEEYAASAVPFAVREGVGL